MYVGAGLAGLYFAWTGIVWTVVERSIFHRMAVEFDWEQTKGFKEIKGVYPPLAYPLLPQALPLIASSLRKAGWKSAQGACYVTVLGGVLVLGLNRWVDCQLDVEVTPLMRAAKDGDVAAVEKLLAGGTDPNVQNQRGWTALIYASFNFRDPDNPLVTKALLGSGADPNIKAHDGLTTLDWASLNCRPRVAAALIEGGADLSKYGRTALHHASYVGCTEVIELLKQRGVRP
jgi:hypothetical protein